MRPTIKVKLVGSTLDDNNGTFPRMERDVELADLPGREDTIEVGGVELEADCALFLDVAELLTDDQPAVELSVIIPPRFNVEALLARGWRRA